MGGYDKTPPNYANIILQIYNYYRIKVIPNASDRNKIYKNFRDQSGISEKACSDECFNRELDRVVEHLFPGTLARQHENAQFLSTYSGVGAGTRSKKTRRKTHSRRSKKSRRSRRIRRR